MLVKNMTNRNIFIFLDKNLKKDAADLSKLMKTDHLNLVGFENFNNQKDNTRFSLIKNQRNTFLIYNARTKKIEIDYQNSQPLNIIKETNLPLSISLNETDVLNIFIFIGDQADSILNHTNFLDEVKTVDGLPFEGKINFYAKRLIPSPEKVNSLPSKNFCIEIDYYVNDFIYDTIFKKANKKSFSEFALATNKINDIPLSKLRKYDRKLVEKCDLFNIAEDDLIEQLNIISANREVSKISELIRKFNLGSFDLFLNKSAFLNPTLFLNFDSSINILKDSNNINDYKFIFAKPCHNFENLISVISRDMMYPNTLTFFHKSNQEAIHELLGSNDGLRYYDSNNFMDLIKTLNFPHKLQSALEAKNDVYSNYLNNRFNSYKQLS